ncbi:MAG: hypothetical protein AAGG72_09370, partial [Pseudomonadota bacterium]
MKTLVIAAGLCVMSAWPSEAQTRWVFSEQKDDFGTEDMRFAAAADGLGRLFGVRCVKGKLPALVYSTKQEFSDGLELLTATLLVSVDDGEVVEREAA